MRATQTKKTLQTAIDRHLENPWDSVVVQAVGGSSPLAHPPPSSVESGNSQGFSESSSSFVRSTRCPLYHFVAPLGAQILTASMTKTVAELRGRGEVVLALQCGAWPVRLARSVANAELVSIVARRCRFTPTRAAPIRPEREFSVLGPGSARGVWCSGRAGQVDALTSSLAAQCATWSG